MAYSQSDITNAVSTYLKERFLAPNVSISLTDKFYDVGVDSMTVVELVMFIEEKFGIAIPADQLTGVNLESIESLARCAEKNQSN